MDEKRIIPIRERKGLFFALLIFVSFITLIVSTKSLMVSPKQIGMTVFSVFQKGFTGIGGFFGDTFDSIREIDRLRGDYNEAVSQIEKYKNIERGYLEIKSENERLREQLGFSSQILYKHIPAEVIAKDAENLFSTIVINKGSRDGIRTEMPVIAFQNGVQGLVGKITDVGLSSSVILPVYDSFSYISARLADSRYEGLVTGDGHSDSPLVMKYVNKRAKDETQYGDIVVTSGLNSLFPRDLYIGRVRSIKMKDYETSLNLELDSVLDFSKLEYVFVLDATGPSND
jgi:rod shape-determining protein MreC